MDESVSKEICLHGPKWGSLHGGYFSDVVIARPLVEKIIEALTHSRPEAVVDLGGGTGFLLSQLVGRGVVAGMKLVNLDCSDVQLATASGQLIHCILASIADFRRKDIAPEKDRLLWIMRSALHYFGENGLLPALQYLRGQAREGEFFVHQTASFESERDADCLNFLYREMGSHKWYPTVNQLCRLMVRAGWHLIDVSPAPALPLTSEELDRRYHIGRNDIMRIRNEIAQQFGKVNGIFTPLPEGFCAHLHYRIYTCVASDQKISDTTSTVRRCLHCP